MDINCISCGHEFEYETYTITLEGVDIVYSECPGCSQRYLSFVVDKELKERFKKTQHQLDRSEDRNLTYAQRQKAFRKHRRLVDDNRRLIKQKKAEYQYLIEQVINP